MQNVVYTGKTSEYTRNLCRKGLRARQENNSTDQEDKQRPLCTCCKFFPGAVNDELEERTAAAPWCIRFEGPRVKSFNAFIWKLSILEMKDGRTGWQTAISFPRSMSDSLFLVQQKYHSEMKTSSPFCFSDSLTVSRRRGKQCVTDLSLMTIGLLFEFIFTYRLRAVNGAQVKNFCFIHSCMLKIGI